MCHFLCQALHFLLSLAAFAHVCAVRGSKALLQRLFYPVSKGRRGYKQVRSPSEPCDNSDSTTRVERKRQKLKFFFYTFPARLSDTALCYKTLSPL